MPDHWDKSVRVVGQRVLQRHPVLPDGDLRRTPALRRGPASAGAGQHGVEVHPAGLGRGQGLVEGLPAVAAAEQEVLGAEHLGHLAEHRRAALGRHAVAHAADDRVGRDAREAVGTAALEAHHDPIGEGRTGSERVGTRPQPRSGAEEGGAEEGHAIQYIRNHYADNLKVTDIANYICVDRSYLYKLFEKTLEMSPKEFLMRFRISRGKELLTITELSIEEVATECGYKDFRAFSRLFKKVIGTSPMKYRKEHRREVREHLVQGEQNVDALMEEEEPK